MATDVAVVLTVAEIVQTLPSIVMVLFAALRVAAQPLNFSPLFQVAFEVVALTVTFPVAGNGPRIRPPTSPPASVPLPSELPQAETGPLLPVTAGTQLS